QRSVGGRVRPDHVLHGEPHVDQVPVGRDVYVLQVVQQRRAVVPGHRGGPLHHVVAVQRRDRHERQVPDVQAGGEGRELGGYPLEHGLRVVDQVHLVHGQHHVRHPQQRGQERVPPGLLGEPVPCVHQHHGQIRGG